MLPGPRPWTRPAQSQFHRRGLGQGAASCVFQKSTKISVCESATKGASEVLTTCSSCLTESLVDLSPIWRERMSFFKILSSNSPQHEIVTHAKKILLKFLVMYLKKNDEITFFFYLLRFAPETTPKLCTLIFSTHIYGGEREATSPWWLCRGSLGVHECECNPVMLMLPSCPYILFFYEEQQDHTALKTVSIKALLFFFLSHFARPASISILTSVYTS